MYTLMEPGKDNTGDRDSSPSLEEVKLDRIKFSFCKYKETLYHPNYPLRKYGFTKGNQGPTEFK